MNKFLYQVIFRVPNHNRIEWCLAHLGPSIYQDLINGRWYVHRWEGNIEYYFKHEQDAVLFRLTWT